MGIILGTGGRWSGPEHGGIVDWWEDLMGGLPCTMGLVWVSEPCSGPVLQQNENYCPTESQLGQGDRVLSGNGWACRGSETEQDLVGLLGTEAFKTVANQGRKGMQKQGRSSQETIMHFWGRVLVPPQGIHITISLSSLQS